MVDIEGLELYNKTDDELMQLKEKYIDIITGYSASSSVVDQLSYVLSVIEEIEYERDWVAQQEDEMRMYDERVPLYDPNNPDRLK